MIFAAKVFASTTHVIPWSKWVCFLMRMPSPVTYRLFKGNTHDSQTMMPLLQETRKAYGLEKIVVVADKGLNSGDNVAFLMAKGDGFIFSQKIRGASPELKAYVLDPADYVEKEGVIKSADLWGEQAENHQTPVFRMKSRPFPQEFGVTYADDRKRRISLDVKQIVCYNELYARRQKHKRAEVLEKAQKIIAHPPNVTIKKKPAERCATLKILIITGKPVNV